MTLGNWEQEIPLMSNGYHIKLVKDVDRLRREQIIYPSKNDVFAAFKLTPFESVKIVLIGQDPYHSPKLAHGLAFSVPNGIKIPPSLRNIFQEITNDIEQTSNPEQIYLDGQNKASYY